MGKAKVDVISTMTRVEMLARIIELKNAVDWRDAKLAEQERTIERLRELLDEARARLCERGTSADVPLRPKSQP